MRVRLLSSVALGTISGGAGFNSCTVGCLYTGAAIWLEALAFDVHLHQLALWHRYKNAKGTWMLHPDGYVDGVLPFCGFAVDG